MLEGIRFASNVGLATNNVTISKCSFLAGYYNFSGNNIQLIHSKFLQFADFDKQGISVNCINCIFNDGAASYYGSCLVSFLNCTFIGCPNPTIWAYGASYTNCLIVDQTGGDHFFNERADVNGCTYVGSATAVYRDVQKFGNVSLPAETPVFKEGTATCELLDENVTTWLGLDGTQVGVHGGSLPFDPETSNPKITKFNVAPKTTADGKLSVDIEIKAL